MAAAIIVYGNPIDGFNFRGPFADREEAIRYADNVSNDDGDWWVAELNAPVWDEPANSGE